MSSRFFCMTPRMEKFSLGHPRFWKLDVGVCLDHEYVEFAFAS